MDTAAPDSTAMDVDALSLQIKVKTHWAHPRAIKLISVQVMHPQLGDIGSLNAWRISRSQCAGSFLEILDEDKAELHQFSMTLFDKYGNLRPHLLSPGYRSGTGCWGREMDSGELLYILDVTVNESHREKGVGTWALFEFLKSQHVQADDTVVCWPTPVGIL
ncbi:hypothetical protein B0H14DRAFT_1528208 [Mycena olivaceomarginata]|nr:hypothetical protein B0H14DRAFT_1528208 [Mycena olivaceomarginata]